MFAIVPPLDRNLSDAAKARAQSHSCSRRADLSGAVADKRMPRVASMRAGIGDSISIESAAGLKKAEDPSYHAAGGSVGGTRDTEGRTAESVIENGVDEWVDQTGARWNQLVGWLHQVAALRGVAS